MTEPTGGSLRRETREEAEHHASVESACKLFNVLVTTSSKDPDNLTVAARVAVADALFVSPPGVPRASDRMSRMR